MDLNGLLGVIQQIAVSLPSPAVEHLASAIESLSECPAAGKLANLGSTPRSRELLSKLSEEWSVLGSAVEGRMVSVALRAAHRVVYASSDRREPEIAWTGPSTTAVPTRRVDQVLYELIAEARSEIWLVSYVAYGAERAVDALAMAATRGVRIRLVLELASESGGKLSFDTADQLRARLPMANLYYWPLENRRVDQEGRHGILHAKCIVCDRTVALISSANLTDYALELNLELGLALRGGAVPLQLADHFEQLVLRGELRELT